MTKQKEAAPFVVPTMAELSTDYAERVERLEMLRRSLGELHAEKRRLVAEIEDTPALDIQNRDVARLLGDEAVDKRSELRARLDEVRNSITDHETAITLQQRRIEEVRPRASLRVREAVKPEYGKRVAALADALQRAHEARIHYEQLRDNLESEGVAWTRLGVFVPTFLGDRQDGHVQRFVKEAREAGYVD